MSIASILRNVVFPVFFLLLTQPAYALDAVNVYKQSAPSVYLAIGISDENEEKIWGSAVAISKEVLASNCHLFLERTTLYILEKGVRYPTTNFYYNEDQDLCLFTVPGLTLHPIKMKKSADAEIGSKVFAIGNPLALGDPHDVTRSLSDGLLSNKIKMTEGYLLQTTAAIFPGSSGGGLFDEDGNLLGLTTLKLKDEGNMGYAIPTEWILTAMQSQSNPTPRPMTTPTSSGRNSTARALDHAQRFMQ